MGGCLEGRLVLLRDELREVHVEAITRLVDVRFDGVLPVEGVADELILHRQVEEAYTVFKQRESSVKAAWKQRLNGIDSGFTLRREFHV